MEVAFDSLWVADCEHGEVARISLDSGAVIASIAVGKIAEESSIAATEDAVFVLVDDGSTIVEIDSVANAVAATFDAPAGASAMRGESDRLWVTSAARALLSLVDPAGGRVEAEVGVGRGARFLAVGAGSVWTLDSVDHTVSRVDTATAELIATIAVADVPITGGDMAFGGGSAWARVSDALVVEVDPATNTAVRRIGTSQGSGSVAADDSAVWVSAHDVFRVYRIPRD
jgi:hypothetical protein